MTVLREPVRVELSGTTRVEVDGTIWSGVTEILSFAGPSGRWARVFYRRGRSGEEAYSTYPEEKVRLIPDSTALLRHRRRARLLARGRGTPRTG